jgi:hypothetical protein
VLDERGNPLLDARGKGRRERLGRWTPGKEVPCWDLTFYVDGQEFFARFPKAGLADAVKLQLEADFREGLLFDPLTKRFANDAGPVPPVTPTVYSEAVAYLRGRRREWEPKTRREALKALRRACIELTATASTTGNGPCRRTRSAIEHWHSSRTKTGRPSGVMSVRYRETMFGCPPRAPRAFTSRSKASVICDVSADSFSSLRATGRPVESSTAR